MSRTKGRGRAATLTADAPADDPGVYRNPFTVVIDRREQKPYLFDGLRTNADLGNRPIRVDLRFDTLTTGDYSIFGLPIVTIERKSKEDLYGSISQARQNFEARLRRMSSEFWYSAVVVEADWEELLSDPPRHTQFSPKALARTIQAWAIRYPRVHWWFLWCREAAENFTFRLLEKFWQAHQDRETLAQAEYRDRLEGLEPARPVVIGYGEMLGEDVPACPKCGTTARVVAVPAGLTSDGRARAGGWAVSPTGWFCDGCGVGW